MRPTDVAKILEATSSSVKTLHFDSSTYLVFYVAKKYSIEEWIFSFWPNPAVIFPQLTK